MKDFCNTLLILFIGISLFVPETEAQNSTDSSGHSSSQSSSWRSDVPVLPDSTLIQNKKAEREEDSAAVQGDSASALVRQAEQEEVQPADGNSPGSEAGFVSSSETGDPVAGAAVLLMLEPLRFSAKTDQDGLFRLKDLPPGTYTLTVYKKGYSQFKSTEWKVHSGKNPFRELTLNKKVLKGRLMEIAPPKSSASKSLLARKRESGVVLEGVSAEQISKSTDSDAGAIARRVTGTSVVGDKYVYVRGLGERYTTMTLNGLPVPTPEKDKRVVPQDLFPAGVIENLVIYKTLNPDLVSDWAGGLINLSTKGIPNKDVYKISVSSGARDFYGDGKFLTVGDERLVYENESPLAYYFGYDMKGRQVPAGVPTIVDQTMSSDTLAGYARRFNNKWGVDTGRVLPNQSYSATVGKVYPLGKNERTGFLGHVSFKNSYKVTEENKVKVGKAPLQIMKERTYVLPDTTLVLEVPVTVKYLDPETGDSVALLSTERGVEQWITKGSYKATTSGMLNWGYENPDHQLWFKSFFANIAEDRTNYTLSVKDSIVRVSLGQEDDIEERFLLEYQRRAILVGQLGGGHFLGVSVLDSLAWAAGLAKTIGEIPDSRKYFYIRRDSTTLEYDAKPPYGTRQYDKFGELGAAGRFDFFWVIPPSLSKRDIFLTEGTILSDVTLPRGKFGNLTNFKRRKYDIIRYVWDSDIIDKDLLTDTTNNYDLVETLHHPDSVYGRVLDNGSGFRSSFNDYDNYQNNEFSTAGYFLVESSLKLFSIPIDMNAGLRYEFHLVDFTAPFTGESKGQDAEDIEVKNSGHYFYPSGGLGFTFFPKTKLRFIYSQCRIRSEVRERAPILYFDTDDEIEVIGNPELRDTKVKNYDVRFDWFLPYGQTFSVSGFIKDFTDPIERIIDFNLSPNRRKFQNASGGFLLGGELDVTLSPYRLLNNYSPLKGFTLYANAAWINTRAKLDRTGIDSSAVKQLTNKSRSMLGQSAVLYNVKLTHEKDWGNKNWLNGVLFNYTGSRIDDVGMDNVNDIYEIPPASLDFLSKYTVGRYTFSLKIKNLLNEKKRFTISEWHHLRDYPGITTEQRDEYYAGRPQEYVQKQSDIGVSYSVGISAKF